MVNSINSREDMLDHAIRLYRQDQYSKAVLCLPEPECHYFALPWKYEGHDTKGYVYTVSTLDIIMRLRLPSDPMTVNERWKVIHDR